MNVVLGKHTGFLEDETTHRVRHNDYWNLAHLDGSVAAIFHAEKQILGEIANGERSLLSLG